MFRIWGKLIQDNHLLKDHTVCDDSNATRTQKVFHGKNEKTKPMVFGRAFGNWNDSFLALFL